MSKNILKSKGSIYRSLPHNTATLKEIRAETQGMKLKSGTKSGQSKGAAHMIAPQGSLKLLYDKNQDCLSMGGTSYKERDSSTPIINKKKVPDSPANKLILLYQYYTILLISYRCISHLKVPHFK